MHDFEEYEKKLKEQKDQWKKDNPELWKEKQKDDYDDGDLLGYDRELQQIFEGQSTMREIMQDLHRKMDEIIGRQERTLSLVSQVNILFFF